VNKILLACISFALIVPVSHSSGQQLIDGDILPLSRVSIMDNLRLAELRGYSSSGTHQCGSEKGRSCVVTGSGFSNCYDASIALRTRDCCPTTPAGGKSSAFTLNYCIPDRP
jgi:hypothetical protein